MGDVTVIGLGRMGSALAGALIVARHRVVVWNRTSDRAAPLVARGAEAAVSLADAVAASPVVVICVDSYDSTRTLFERPAARSALSGRTVAQLTTGTPRQARQSEAWFTALGARYLDGAILGGPAAIGTPRVTLLYGGLRGTFEACAGLLGALGENSRHVSDDAGSAAAVDLAWLCRLYGSFAAACHGVLICESEGVDLEHYSNVLSANDPAHWLVDVVKSGAYANPRATLHVWNEALRRIVEQAGDVGLPTAVPDLVAAILDRAEAAGLGEEDIAAMIKVMRAGQGQSVR